jgi:hypothetical protein
MVLTALPGKFCHLHASLLVEQGLGRFPAYFLFRPGIPASFNKSWHTGREIELKSRAYARSNGELKSQQK